MWETLVEYLNKSLLHNSWITKTMQEKRFTDAAKKNPVQTGQVTSLLLSQQDERRKSLNRAGRRASNVTGGLSGNPTLGGLTGLFGL